MKGLFAGGNVINSVRDVSESMLEGEERGERREERGKFDSPC